MSARSNYSVMLEIRKTEEAIKITYKRINALERKLQSQTLPENKQNEIKRELKEVRKLLSTHEAQLKRLRTQNSQSFLIAAGIIFLVFLMYMIFVLMNETS